MTLPALWVKEALGNSTFTFQPDIGGRLDSVFVDINVQVDMLHKEILSQPELRHGFNLIGHSQGGVISRAYVERYNGSPNPPVFNLITWSGPHGGQYGIPAFNKLCPDQDCPYLIALFTMILDSWADPLFQEHCSFATYWRDPFHYQDFLKYSTFLADINNVKPIKNQLYKQNMQKLEHFVMEYSTIDEIIIPYQSGAFGTYALNSEKKIVPLNQSDLYANDYLGLRYLDERSRLHIYATQCEHTHYTEKDCKHYFTQFTLPYLK